MLDQVLARDGAGARRLAGEALGRRARLAVGAGELDPERLAEAGTDAHVNGPFALHVRLAHARGGVHSGLRADDAHDRARLHGPRRAAADGLAGHRVALGRHREELRGVAHRADLEKVALPHRLGKQDTDLGTLEATHARASAVAAAAPLDAVLERSGGFDLAHDLAPVV